MKILIGNKCDDANNRMVSYQEGLEFAEAYKIGFMETSAKIGTNVTEAFTHISRAMKETHAQVDRESLTKGKINLNED